MSLPQDPGRGEKLISQLLLEDGDLRDIVEEFVGALEGRISEMKAAHSKLDWEQMTTLAHRLKGAAGSYGYPEMSEVCATMEREFRIQQADDFESWVERLHGMAVAAQEGLGVTPE